MSGRSLFSVRFRAAALATLFAVFSFESAVQADELDEQTSLVEAAERSSPEDRAIAISLAERARQRAKTDIERLGAPDWGPLSKLWCEAVLAAPSAENLAECAHARISEVSQMSNPQPSLNAVRLERSRKALILVRAALEIAGGDPDVQDALRLRLRREARCLRANIAGATLSPDCDS